jgi:hypothetical protein
MSNLRSIILALALVLTGTIGVTSISFACHEVGAKGCNKDSDCCGDDVKCLGGICA